MKTYFNKKSASLFATLMVFVLLISSCKKDPVAEPVVYGSAKIRVVNTVNGSLAQDFYQGTAKKSVSPIAYGQNSDYITVAAGNSTISFKNTGTEVTTASQNIGAYTDASYTAFTATNSAGGVQVIGFEDDTVVPATGKAKVRFVNLGTVFTNTVNVTSAGVAIVTGLQLGYASAYNTVDVNAALSVQVIGGTAVAVPTTLQSGKIYTIWLDAANTTTASIHVIQQN
jgi:hypothetical protein